MHYLGVLWVGVDLKKDQTTAAGIFLSGLTEKTKCWTTSAQNISLITFPSPNVLITITHKKAGKEVKEITKYSQT